MSEASSKGHTFGALVVLLVISALCAWGFSLMNDGDMGSGAGANKRTCATGRLGPAAAGKATPATCKSTKANTPRWACSALKAKGVTIRPSGETWPTCC